MGTARDLVAGSGSAPGRSVNCVCFSLDLMGFPLLQREEGGKWIE